MAFFEHNGAEIFYEVWGAESGAKQSRPWLTLLNGHSRTSTDFKAMARFFIERNWNVLTLDNRGAGQTVSPLNFTLADSASDVVRLWDHLGITSSSLLGISYGGVLAMYVAIESPHRLDRLILVSTAARNTDIHSSRDMTQYFSKAFTEKHAIMIRAFSKEMSQVFEAPEKAGLAEAQRKALQGFDITGQLSKIGVPTLVIHGDSDQIIALEAGKLLYSKIPKCRIEIYEGAGHLLLAEMPKRLYESAWKFCVENP